MTSVASSDVLDTSSSLLSSLSNNPNIVGSTWMLSSALLTTYSTTRYLKFETSSTTSHKPSTLQLSRPTLLTLSRFGGSLLLGILAHPNLEISKRIQETVQNLPGFTLPAAFLFLANFMNSISLDRIGISLTYTSKCAIPLMTVILTVLLDGRKALPNTSALLSLLPIALGIGAASWNSPTFKKLGFAAAMVSCVAQSALNVTSKRAMMKTGLTGPDAQRCMVAVGLLIAVVYSFFQVVSRDDEDKASTTAAPPPAWLAGMAVTAYHIEYVLSFMFVKLVAPITYGACDAVRRLSIILSGRWMFGGEPFTRLNVAGIGLALLGALGYSIASSSSK